MNKGVLAWFARNSVAANILMLLVLGAGALSLWQIKIEVFPEVESSMISIRVPYLGASPAEVEEGVCMRVEEAISGVENIKRIRSVASEGFGSIFAELEEGVDALEVLDDVKAEVDRITTFPAETEKPVVSDVTNRQQVITIALYGDVSERTLKYLAEGVRDELVATDIISQVELAGVRRYELSIEVSEDSLRQYGLSLGQVAEAVRNSSLDLPGGSVKTSGGEVLIRTKGQRYRGRDFESIVVRTRSDGTRLLLSDIATVVDGFEDTDTASRFGGKPAALVMVYRVGNQGAIDVSDTVHRYVEDKQDELPAGVEISTWADDARILRSRIDLLLRNAAIGFTLVFLALALFLDLRLAFWTSLGIPISFLGAFYLIPMFGVSVNMLSLFAFIVSLGIVVDDAIVVGENIFTYRNRGLDSLDAAIKGVQEMAVPVTFAILTSVVAFAPLMFTAGNIGKIMRVIPIVVISVLMISLLEGLLILPAHLAHTRVRKVMGPVGRAQARVRDGLDAFIQGPYARLLKRAVTWRYVTVAAAVATLMATVGFVAGGRIQFTFMPKIDADNMVALLTMPQGTPVELTEAAVNRLEAAVEATRADFDAQLEDGQASLVNHISTTIGQHPSTSRRGPMAQVSGSSSSTSHLAEVNVELQSSETRTQSSIAMVNRWRELSGEVPGAVNLSFTSSLFTAGNAIDVEMAHRDFDTLLKAAERLKGAVSEFDGVSDVSDSFLPGKMELKLNLRQEGRAAGLTLSDLARQVRAGFYGAEAQRIQRGRDDVRVMVRYPEAERRSLADVDRMRVRLPNGSAVPFNTVAEVVEGRGYAEDINRTDRRRVVSVTADVDESVSNSNEINQQLRAKVLPLLVQDYPGLTFSFEGVQREQADSMKSLATNFIAAQFAIFALLAIPLKRYIQPIIIMTAIPFGLVGAIWGHVIMGYDLSILSIFGIVALTGVVVNDSLIMIDLINRETRAGVPIHQAILDSGTRRFRPIMLTTLTTFLGLSPMILETSVQARFLVPMALSLGFGVVFATGITLLLVPALYAILEDFHGVFGGGAESEAVPEGHSDGRESAGASGLAG